MEKSWYIITLKIENDDMRAVATWISITLSLALIEINLQRIGAGGRVL